MDRKLIWGCLGVVVLIVVTLLVVFYVTVFRPTQAIMPDLEMIGDLAALNEGIAITSDFRPPDDGVFTAEQLERFTRVQHRMRDGLGAEYAVLAERADELHGLQFGGGNVRAKTLTVRNAILLFKGLGPLLTRAKEAQVAGINSEGFSLEEYRWVRESFYSALEFSRVDVYLEDFEAFTAGNVDFDSTEETDPESTVPTANRDQAALYSDSARQWFPYLVFGL